MRVMDENFLKNVRAKIKGSADLSIAGLAVLLGKSESQTYRILDGSAPYKTHYTRIMREYVGIGTRLDREGNTMAVIDLVDLKTASSLENEGDVICRVTLLETMLPFDTDPKSIKLIKVTGDHCEPEYKPGEYAFVNIDKTMPEPPGVFLLWSGVGYKLQFCEHVFGSEPAEVKISSTNKVADYSPTQVSFSKANLKGRVIGKISIRI